MTQQYFQAPPSQVAVQTANFDQLDVLTQPLFDKINISTVIPTGVQTFFAVQRGGSATIIRGASAASYNKTSRDTNLEAAGTAPQKAYTIVGLSLDYIPISPAAGTVTGAFVTQDIMTLKNGAWIQMYIFDKPIFQLPCKIIPATDPFTSTTLNASLASGVSNMGKIPMYHFSPFLGLPPLATFRVEWQFDPPATAVALNQTFDIVLTFHAQVQRPT